MKSTNYSYVGIAFIVLVFGIIFIPRIIDRIQNNDVTRLESRSDNVKLQTKDDTQLSYLVINGERKKVMPFSFTNQYGKVITNKDFEGKVYLVEFFFTQPIGIKINPKHGREVEFVCMCAIFGLFLNLKIIFRFY